MIYDITKLYPLHQSIISHIKLIISDSTSTVSLSPHPDNRSYNPHCMYDNTLTIYMISYEYIWHDIHSLWNNSTLWHSHTLFSCHHTQDTCHDTHCSWAITCSVLIIAHVQYVWYKTHCMYDIIWILCDITITLYDITRLYHDITSTLFLTLHKLYTKWHTLFLWHHSHCNYDKTYYVSEIILSV